MLQPLQNKSLYQPILFRFFNFLLSLLLHTWLSFPLLTLVYIIIYTHTCLSTIRFALRVRFTLLTPHATRSTPHATCFHSPHATRFTRSMPRIPHASPYAFSGSRSSALYAPYTSRPNIQRMPF